MKPILILVLLSLSARAAEPKTPPAVAAGRFYAQAKVVNVLMTTQLRFAKLGLEYGEKSDLRAMYENSKCYLNFDEAGKELTVAAAGLPAKPSPDAASKALLALADGELAQAAKTEAEVTALIEGSRAKILQNEKSLSREITAGLPSGWMLLDMLKPRPVAIAQARAAAAGKR